MNIDKNEAAEVIMRFLSLIHDMGVLTDADVHNVWLYILENCELFTQEQKSDIAVYFYPVHEVVASLVNPSGDGKLLGYDAQIENVQSKAFPRWRRIPPVGEI